MDYYTSYTLDVKGVNPEDMSALYAALSGAALIGYVFNEAPWVDSHGVIEYYSDDATKWYDHDDDIKRISALFPNAVFKLHGEGDDCGDIWDTYYYNGVMEYCPYVSTAPKLIKWE